MTPSWRLEQYAHLPSTQTVVVERAVAGEPAGLVVLAAEQSLGRGRAGRHWRSEPGNLNLSVLLRPAGAARDLPQWSLLAGIALAEAALPIASGRLSLKWPNDLLRDGAKCAGILAEAAPSSEGGIAWLVLGIGVNLAHAPSLPDRRTTTLGEPEPASQFALRLLSRLTAWQALVAHEGFRPVRTRWMELGPVAGATISLRDGPEGARYLGLAEDGALLVEARGIRQTIHAGEILGEGET